jgi:hypothetical protein
MFNGRRQPSCGGTSRMMREYQVRFCERLGVKFPGPTRQNPKLPHRNSNGRFTSMSGHAAASSRPRSGARCRRLGAPPGHARSPGAAWSVSGPPSRAALDQNRRESISSRRERIELGIELTPSGSAGAVVRLVAVLVWANRLAIVAVTPTRVNLRILRLPLLSADRRHPVLHSTRRSANVCDGGHEKND